VNDNDQNRLRNLVSAELKAVLDKHDVAGVVLVISRDSAAWLTVFPKWSGLQRDPVHGARLRINSKTPEAKAQGDSTMHMIVSIRDMCGEYHNVFGRMFRQARDALRAQGAVVEHKPFGGDNHGIDPFGGKAGTS
jgi:hypothetical protein